MHAGEAFAEFTETAASPLLLRERFGFGFGRFSVATGYGAFSAATFLIRIAERCLLLDDTLGCFGSSYEVVEISRYCHSIPLGIVL